MFIFFVAGILFLATAICAMYLLARLPVILSAFVVLSLGFLFFSFPDQWAIILAIPMFIGGVIGFFLMAVDGLIKTINDPTHIPKSPRIGLGGIALTTFSTGYLVSQDVTRKRDI